MTNTRKRYRELYGLIREIVSAAKNHRAEMRLDIENFALDLVYVFVKDGEDTLREALYRTIRNACYEAEFKNKLHRYCKRNGIPLRHEWSDIPF